MNTDIAGLVTEGNLDALVMAVDSLCEQRAWDDLEALRWRCRRALERGHQLWPIASLCEYRLALLAPGPQAAAVLVDDTGTLALGPLPEVAASTHKWADLEPHVEPGPVAGVAAHECIVRGEDLTGAGGVWAQILCAHGVPLRVASWEPSYPLATYTDTSAIFGGPPVVACTQQVHADACPVGGPDAGVMALRDLVSGWVGDSATAMGPAATVVTVDADAASAVATVAHGGVAMARLSPAEALATMAWASAAGGLSGRRRGMARGRLDALWCVAALGGCDEKWPLSSDELGEVAGELEWWAFDHGAPTDGWTLRLAVADPTDGVAWAIDATLSTAGTRQTPGR